MSSILHDRMLLSHPVARTSLEHGAFQNSSAAKCRVFWPFMQCERVPNDHLPECGQQNLDSECVLLMEGKLVRRILGSVQQQVWNLRQTLFDDASSSFRPGTNRYSPPFTFTNVGRSNRKGCLARDRQLRTFAACDVDRVLVVWIESDELAARYR